MSGVNYSDLQSVGNLMELYANDMQVIQNVRSSLWNFIRDPSSGEVNLDGSGWNIGVNYALNESFGAKNDGERLPDAEQYKGLFAKYAPKLNYSAMELTSFAATRGHKGGRPGGKYADDYLKSTLLAFMANLDSDAYANGRGYRATVLTATPTDPSFSVESSSRIRITMPLDWYDATLTTKRGTIKIGDKGIDKPNRTVYIDSGIFDGQVPAGAVAGDQLVVYGALAPGEPTDGRHIGGLSRICDASVPLGNLSPANYAWWIPTNINAGGQNPNELILQQHCDWMDEIGGAYPDRLAINPHWRRAYMAGLLTQRMFTTSSYETGMSNLSFSAVKMGKDASGKTPPKMEILEDKNQLPSEYNIWVNDALCKASDYSEQPHIADEDGSDFRYRPNYDSQHGFMRWWGQMVVKKRSCVGRGYGFATLNTVL